MFSRSIPPGGPDASYGVRRETADFVAITKLRYPGRKGVEQCWAGDSSEGSSDTLCASPLACWPLRPAPTPTIACGPWTCLLRENPFFLGPKFKAIGWSCRL